MNPSKIYISVREKNVIRRAIKLDGMLLNSSEYEWSEIVVKSTPFDIYSQAASKMGFCYSTTILQ